MSPSKLTEAELTTTRKDGNGYLSVMTFDVASA
jgi:hypothetical protein